MMKPRNLLLLFVMSVLILGPGSAMAADEATTSTTPSTTSESSVDSAPLTLDQDQIDALTDAANGTEDDQSVFEKASDFVTDNAPWFIIGIIVLAAIIAGILIMRGRPRKSASPGTPKASKSNKSMRAAGGTSTGQPAAVPSASELRRRKRAAIQRSREEERLRRKAGIEDRKASRRGGVPAAPAAAAGVSALSAAGPLDPVEAEKQGARDQETAAAAVARFGAAQAPVDQGSFAQEPVAQEPALPPPGVSSPAMPGQTIPAPVSPSQTAPAAGVVTPGSNDESETYAGGGYPADQAPAESDTIYESAAEAQPEAYEEPSRSFESGTGASPEAETSILHEPSIESPGPDAAVGDAATAFLAGGAAGAAGGFAAARSNAGEAPATEPEEPLDPVIAPEPGMAAEYALADTVPAFAEPVREEEPAREEEPVKATPPAVAPVSAESDERLRAKVAEIKATQEPVAPEPAPLGAATDLSPGLAAVERRLSENSEERDRTLRDAEDRLRRVEQRAEDAERRAAFAERLAQLKVEESEREKRLNDVVSGIDRAEQRAREAETRAEAAERAAAAALERSDLRLPESPRPDVAASAPEPAAAEPPPLPERPSTPVTPPAPGPATEAPAPERRGLFGESDPKAGESGSDSVNLNSATFEELREAGLSVTQATRILAYRERFGGYGSVEDLEKVPGFPADLIESLRTRLTI
jgi:competence ComEA-like helix-hairpin-helix protein